MRTWYAVGWMTIVLLSLSGCGGSNNQPQAEKLAQQVIDEMNSIATAFENGDKTAIRASSAKISDLAKAGKELKLTKSQDKAVEEKFKPQVKAAEERMKQAVLKAMTAGKMSPADVMEVGQELKRMGESLQK